MNNCPGINPGIKKCQANGKKVLLSLGGGYPTNYNLPTRELAEYFAEFLWGAFGPQDAKWVADKKPRPFGDAAFDGFDLDIESNWFGAPEPFTGAKSANYAHLVNHFKKLFPKDKKYYISGAPQCIVPDTHLADAITNSSFDFIFVQFYNTPQCSTRAGYNGVVTPKSNTFTFDTWVEWLKKNSKNPNVKLYIGAVSSQPLFRLYLLMIV